MSDPFKWRQYEGEIILTCVRWYLRYALSCRDLAEMMTERDLSVDHSTSPRFFATLCYTTQSTVLVRLGEPTHE
jgi:transposase-like protein